MYANKKADGIDWGQQWNNGISPFTGLGNDEQGNTKFNYLGAALLGGGTGLITWALARLLGIKSGPSLTAGILGALATSYYAFGKQKYGANWNMFDKEQAQGLYNNVKNRITQKKDEPSYEDQIMEDELAENERAAAAQDKENAIAQPTQSTNDPNANGNTVTVTDPNNTGELPAGTPEVGKRFAAAGQPVSPVNPPAAGNEDPYYRPEFMWDAARNNIGPGGGKVVAEPVAPPQTKNPYAGKNLILTNPRTSSNPNPSSFTISGDMYPWLTRQHERPWQERMNLLQKMKKHEGANSPRAQALEWSTNWVNRPMSELFPSNNQQ